jgi:hypothetical protein
VPPMISLGRNPPLMPSAGTGNEAENCQGMTRPPTSDGSLRSLSLAPRACAELPPQAPEISWQNAPR